MTAQSLTKEKLELASKTLSMLAADGVERAASGHPGMPMGMADLAAVLWLKHLRYNPKKPEWFARDRFVLSNGHGSMLLYSLLHLAGFPVTLDDLKSFRQWGSITPGHPESFMTPGVECTSGPLGQGLANAVGMAIGQKVMAARYQQDGSDIVSHRVFCFAGDGCMMEGVTSEASSLAGHLGLDNLVVIYDDNGVSIAGRTSLAFSEDVLKRYESYGWHTQRIDGHNYEQIDRAIDCALAEKGRPSIIAARTVIGRGSPHKADTAEVHGSPLGAEEIALTKKQLGWPESEPFYVPQEVRALFAEREEELLAEYGRWEDRREQWSKKHPDLRKRLDAQLTRTLPEDLEEKLLESVKDVSKPEATRKLSSAVLQAAAREVDSLIGGSADLEPSTLTLIKASSDITRESFSGVNIRFGIREHAMGSVMNGLSYYGGFIPFGSTFLVFADYMRPPIRLAALSHLPGLFIFTHDSIFVGEDGPTHQPIEHVGALRIIPNLFVFRPADAVETAVCYALALKRQDGPSVLALTRQGLPQLERPSSFSTEEIGKGAYTVYSSGDAAPKMVIVATGSEVALAVDAAKELSKTLSLRVVSMPCAEIFQKQSEAFRRELIPPSAKKVVVEAGATFGWLNVLESGADDTLLIGIDRFGASAPYKVLAEKFGFTAKSVVEQAKKRFSL